MTLKRRDIKAANVSATSEKQLMVKGKSSIKTKTKSVFITEWPQKVLSD